MSGELHQSEAFMQDMENRITDYRFRRAGDVPEDVLNLYEEVLEANREAAAVVLMKYLRVVEVDAEHYGVTPLEVFQQHRKGREEEYANFDHRS